MLNRFYSLSVGAKLWSVVGVLALMVAVLVTISLTQSQRQITQTQLRIQGSQQIGQLKPLMVQLQRHRGTVNSILGGNSQREMEIPEIRDAINQQLSQLKSDFPSDDLRAIEQQWLNLAARNNQGKTQAQVYAEHVAVVAQVVELIKVVADRSGLILDDSAYTFYLMDYVAFQAAPMVEFAGQVRSGGENVIKGRQRFDVVDLESLTRLAVGLEFAFDGSLLALQRASQANPAIAARLSGVLTDLEQAGGQAKTSVAQVIDNRYSGNGQDFFDEMSAVIAITTAGFDAANELLQASLAARVDELSQAMWTKAGISLLAAALAFFASFNVLRSVSTRLVQVQRYFKGIQEGDLNQTIEVSGRDDLAQLMQGLQVMQSQLRDRVEADRVLLASNTRIKQGLDCVGRAVMIADPDGKIIYANASAQGLLTSKAADFQSHLGRFNPDELTQMHYQDLLGDPIADLSGSDSLERAVGQSVFRLSTTPVESDGVRLGHVVEWEDLTQIRRSETEIAQLVERANRGDLSTRLDVSGKSGFFLVLAEGLNSMTQTFSDMVEDTRRVVNAIAHGDLTQRIDAEYAGTFAELAEGINASCEQMTAVVHQITQSAEQIRAGAEEIAQGNADLSHRTEEQASSLEETASSMEEMTGLVRQTADYSKGANAQADSVKQRAQQGGAVVQQSIEAMQAITQSSHQISEIITVIDEIAFQTNLLALNAAVEAARAGEQGRGFAVVAGEVRSLAQRSAEAAKEIKELIRGSVARVADGSQLVSASGDTLNELVDSIAQVAVQVSEISSAAQEQAAGIDQVNIAISQMDEMTQQNAALVEQASAASENMADQSRAMVRAVEFFNVAIQSPIAKPVPKQPLELALESVSLAHGTNPHPD